MSKRFYVTDIGALTVHNGTDKFNMSGAVPFTDEAQDKTITLPNGTIFDPVGSANTAPIIPIEFSQDFTYVASSAAAAQSWLISVYAKVGDLENVQGDQLSTFNTYNADCRILRVEEIPVIPVTGLRQALEQISYRVTFKPIEKFTL